MLDYKVSPTRLTQRSRFAQIREWLSKQKELSDHVILVAIENGRIMIHSAAEGEWLVTVDWSGERIAIINSQNLGSPYEFRAFKDALIFLDEMLTHYGVMAAELRLKLAPLAAAAG